MDVYAENILDHYRHPRTKRPVMSGQWSVMHTEKNLSCGDELTLGLTFEGDRVTEMGWDGSGCAISQAAMSLLSEELIGKTAAELSAMTPEHIYELLGVPIGPRRTKCALLCLQTLKNALRRWEGREVQGWSETVQKNSLA